MTDPKTGRKSKLHLLMMKAAMSALRTVALIARREFITRVRTRVFITSTVLVLLGIAGYVALQVNVLNKQTAPKATTVNVAFVGDVSGLANGFTAAAKAANFTITTKTVADEAEGRSQIQQGKLDAVISGPIDKPHLLVSDNFDPQLQGYFQDLVYQHVLDAQLAAAGLNPADIEAKLNAASITVDSVTQAANQRTEKAWSGLIAAILLFLVFQAYGNLIAAGVVEEKANRVVEILLATVRPTQLLVGKVAGIGLVGLFQLTVSGAFAIAAVTVSHLFTVPSIAIGVVLAGILWFLLGFALYGVLYAAAGSLVSRAEEAQGIVLPVTLFIVISYAAALTQVVPMLGGAPMSSLGKWLALIPSISPILMPTGMTTGDIATWEWVLAIILTALTAGLATRVAARIYSNSVLRIGARVRLSDALARVRRSA
jgi:ABC-2 type transport system permease protein